MSNDVLVKYGGFVPDEENSKFFQFIKARRMTRDDLQEIDLACGHCSIQVIPLPAAQTHVFCSQCVHDYQRGIRERAGAPQTGFNFE